MKVRFLRPAAADLAEILNYRRRNGLDTADFGRALKARIRLVGEFPGSGLQLRVAGKQFHAFFVDDFRFIYYVDKKASLVQVLQVSHRTHRVAHVSVPAP